MGSATLVHFVRSFLVVRFVRTTLLVLYVNSTFLVGICKGKGICKGLGEEYKHDGNVMRTV